MPADPIPSTSDFPESRRGSGSFPTTHWSIVVNARADSASEVHAALETLCRQYWYPLYSFVRRTGRRHHEAEECTQDFLARLLATEGVARARPERGRFRTFLLSALRNFLINEWHRSQAAKRGGGEMPLPLEFETASDRFAREPADPGLTPERAFDRQWAFDMIDRTVADLKSEYERSGRGALFAALAPLVWNSGPAGAPAKLAASLGLNTHAFTTALHRLRRRIGERLRAEVAATVANAAEVDDELRYLIAAIADGT